MKVAGCIILFIACCLMGYMKAFTYISRVRELEDIIELIKLLEVEITFRKENLKAAFQRVSKVKKCWFSGVLSKCEEYMHAEKPLNESWILAIGNMKNCPLNNSDLEILNDISIVIGRSDSEGQSKMLQPTIIRLNRNLESARICSCNQGKMYKGIGIASGATLAILLL